jgi:predicted nucleotidyltransferase
MTQSLPNPAEIKAIRDLVASARAVATPLIVVGASARELVFNQRYNIRSHRSTTDWDFGVLVPDWATFERLIDHMVACGVFIADATNQQRFIHEATGVDIDLIPFGGVEREGLIRWPRGGREMNVTGYDEAMAMAEELELAPGLRVRVATVSLLVVLKVFAAADRAAETDRDLTDLRHLIDNYPTAGREAEVYEPPLDAVGENFDWNHLGAFLLGADIGLACRLTTLEHVDKILVALSNPFGQFASRAIRQSFTEDDERQQRKHWADSLTWVRHGLRLSQRNRR